MSSGEEHRVGGPVQRYRSTWAVTFAWIWYAIGAWAAIDLLRSGSGAQIAVGLTFVAFATALVFAMAHRPALLVDDTGIVVRNVVRDVSIPWAHVVGVGTRWSLTMRTDSGDYGVWAVAARNPRRQRGRTAQRLDEYDPSAPSEQTPVSMDILDRLERHQRSAPVPAEVDEPVRVRVVWPVVALVAVTGLAFVVAVVAS